MITSSPNGPQHQTDPHHEKGLQQSLGAELGKGNETEGGNGKVLGRTELQCDLGEELGHKGQEDETDRPGNKGAHGRDEKSGASPPPLGHLIAVEGRHHGTRLAGNIQEDRGGGTAVHRPVVDPGKHDQGRYRGQSVRHPHQKRHGPDRPDTRQNADEGPDECAHQCQAEVGGRQGN